MAQATHRRPDVKPVSIQIVHGLREGALVMLCAIGLYLLLALLSYDPADPGWSHTGERAQIGNLGGVVGAWFADVFLYGFGYLAFLAPVMVAYSGWLIFRGQDGEGGMSYRFLGVRWAGFALMLTAGCGLATLHFVGGELPLNAGGIVGEITGRGLMEVFNLVGTTLLLLALFLAGTTLATGFSWLSLVDNTGRLVLLAVAGCRDAMSKLKERRIARAARLEREEVVNTEKVKLEKRKPPRIEPVINKPARSDRVDRERQIPLFKTNSNAALPPLAALDEPRKEDLGYSEAALEAMSRQVELKLRDFGIEVEVVAVHPGPVITRFELQPAAGVKVSRIATLVKDLARSLSVVSVRIVEVIPGKSVVGLEIPNEHREIVSLSEILHSRAYEQSPSALTLGLGKDIGGHPVIADLSKMPHLLVAGTTGAGKSVAINAMLLSLLYKGTPADVRMILIDPKMLELSVYEGIPHLLTPVVTDMKEAANALRWCVAEMERRYRVMSALGVRNIAGLNKKVKAAIADKKPIPDPLFDPSSVLDEVEPPTLEPMPFIVLVVDEFADMMMVVGKKVEEFIARLAQKARASGIHLVLATQRPSVDVITGLIKANIPCRIAFQVSSKVDSRTIIDQMGAEQLLGHGDMLYLPAGTALPERVHGAFVGDQEVHNVVKYLKSSGEPTYIDEVVSEPRSGTADAIPGLEPVDMDDSTDPLYDQAVAVVTESRKASISYVQRRLKVGYNRAARMIEEMEQSGVVSPLQPNGGREVLAPPPPEL
ncbi:MAG: DNA translocase FtsK [Gammaproteobacteria bacterium]